MVSGQTFCIVSLDVRGCVGFLLIPSAVDIATMVAPVMEWKNNVAWGKEDI